MKKIMSVIAIGLFGFTAIAIYNQLSKPKKDGTYRVPLTSIIESYNPIMGSTVDTSTVVSQIQDTLFTINGTNLTASGANQTPKVSDDGLKYTFTIRENYWVNNKGEKQAKVTAKDYEFGFWSLANPANKSSYATMAAEGNIKNAIKVAKGEISVDQLGVKAIDDQTLEISLETPTPYILELLAYNKFAPISVENVKKQGSLENAYKNPENMWYSGAFYVENEKTNEQYTLSRNDHFHDANKIDIKTVILKVYKDPETAYKEFESGNLDQARLTKKEDVQKSKDNPNIKKVVQGRTAYLAFNQTIESIQNENVRKAIFYGVDYGKIIEETLGIGGSTSNTLTPKTLTESVYKEEYINRVGNLRTFDLEKAREYAAKAREQLNGKLTFKYLARETASEKKLAEAIQGQIMQNIGFDFKVEFVPSKEFVAKARKDSTSYDIISIGWTGDYADPGTFMSIMNKNNPALNFSRNNDQQLVDLISAAQKTGEKNERLNKFVEAEKYAVLDKTYIVPFEQSGYYLATSGKYQFKSNLLKTELYRFFEAK